jgi:hypothetical protein
MVWIHRVAEEETVRLGLGRCGLGIRRGMGGSRRNRICRYKQDRVGREVRVEW